MSVSLQEPILKVLHHLCEDVDTPRSLAVWLLAKEQEVKQLVSLTCLPQHYTSSEDYFKDLVVTEFLRKCDVPGVIQAANLERETWERFLRTELLCKATNIRMKRYQDGLLDQPGDARILSFLQNVKKIIRTVVGPLPKTLLGVRHGPGATTTNSRRKSTIPHKIDSAPSGTARALYLFDTLHLGGAWDAYGSGGAGHRPRIVERGNRFFTVPKTALTLRGACLSPNVNIFLQSGVGGYLRNRLKKVNIHIDDPQGNLWTINGFTTADRHKLIAASASVNDEYATIDLSDASNTISKELVKLLFPSDWHALLCDLREEFVQRPDKRWQQLEMFSAMGNGFTFEVETLIFYALARAVVGDTGLVSVFGDDIIVPDADSSSVIAALKWAGFQINKTKTFTSGPFRESCGGDFFAGVPVRAYYAKELPAAPEQWIAMANGLRRCAFADPRTEHRWSYIRRAWFAVLDAIPRPLRCLRGPTGLKDLVIHDNWRPWKIEGGISYYRCYAPVVRKIPLTKWSSDTVYASVLYGVSSSGVSLRDSVSGYKIKSVPYS